MSRPLRINYPGAYYHVINRGAGYQDIFSRGDHRRLFLDLLHELYETYQMSIHAYCLMDQQFKDQQFKDSQLIKHLNKAYL